VKFDTPATTNPIDQLKVIGHPLDRIDGPLKTTGTAPYAYDRHDVVANQAYGYMLGGPEIQHYHQAIAVVVAETFEQARSAAQLIRVKYSRTKGNYELSEVKDQSKASEIFGGAGASSVGNFTGAFAAAPVQLDQTYSTAHESHCMIEPHASIAAWNGDKLTLWTSNQMIAWTVGDVAKTLGIPKEKVHVMSPFIGGGFGAKLFLRSDALMAALGARAAGRPVKVALQRALVPNNTVHRSATIQRVRIGVERDGKITAIGHESWSGNLPGGGQEAGAVQTRALYAGANRMTSNRLATLDLPEANAMRAPNEAPGLAVLEIAIDEISEKVGMDPVEFRIKNDTQVVPDFPGKSGSSDPLA
jgi:xanthine dehydrogenase YagR molybdenum-binding subunit